MPETRFSPSRLGPLAGPPARWLDRFGMWLMLRSHYGTDYRIEPAQLTQASLDPYLAIAAAPDPERLFPTPRVPEPVALREVAELLDEPERRPIWLFRDAAEEDPSLRLQRIDFAFESAHLPLSRDFEAQYGETPENRTVHGRFYSAEGSHPKRVMLVVHGFGARSLDSVARFTPARRMAARDVAVAVLSLPYHGLRSPASARFSGEYLMSGDVVRTFEGVLQAVSDLRTTIAWLREARGIEQVGLIGASLGGYLATMTAAIEPGVDLLYAIAPPIRVTESLDSVPLGRHIRAGLDRQQVDPELLERLQDLVDPACHRPALPTDRMRFIAGRNDLFVPHTHMQRLIDSWEGLQVHWHDWGHLTALVPWPPRRLFDEIEDFASRHGF